MQYITANRSGNAIWPPEFRPRDRAKSRSGSVELPPFLPGSKRNRATTAAACAHVVSTARGGRPNSRATIFKLALGPLDSDPGIRPEAHWHVAAKAPWY